MILLLILFLLQIKYFLNKMQMDNIIQLIIIIIIFCYWIIAFYFLKYIHKFININNLAQAIDTYENETNSKLVIIVDDDNNYVLRNIILINDSETFLNILRECNNHNKILHIIINSTGGNIVESDVIINAILKHKNIVYSYIPKYAMSAATLLALSTTYIHMDLYAYMSPTDPQIELSFDNKHIVSSKMLIDYAETYKDSINISNDIILCALKAKNLHDDNISSILKILKLKKINKKYHNSICETLGNGKLPHHAPLYYEKLKNIGFHYIDKIIPLEIIDIFDLFEKIL